MLVTIMIPTQEALAVTTVLDTLAMVSLATETEHELSAPETMLSVHPSTNEIQLGASYLNNHVHQVVQIQMSLCAVRCICTGKSLKPSKQKVK